MTPPTVGFEIPPFETMCDVPIQPGLIHLQVGWQPPAFAFARVSVVSGESRIVEIFCSIYATPSCSLASSAPDGIFYFDPLAGIGNTKNQILYVGTMPADSRLVFELSPAAVGLCVAAPCPLVWEGIGIFYLYGFSESS